MRRNFSLFLIFPLTVCLSFLLAACKSKKEAYSDETSAIPVTVTTVVLKDLPVYLESIGSLQAPVLMEIRSLIDGTLLEVLIDEGKWVKKGDLLFRIDSKQYEMKVKEAEAQVAIDRAGYKLLEKKLDRYKSLTQKDLIAQTEWDELETDAEKARNTIDLDEARLHSAKVNLDHCIIYSPIDGRVGRIDAHPGSFVCSGQKAPLTTISKMDPLVVEFTVTEKEFSKIPNDNLKIEIDFLCSEGVCQKGEVTFLDNQFDSKTGLLFILGKIQNDDYKLRPGQSVRVRIPIAVQPNAMLIPQKTIRYNQEGPYVYVVQEDMTVAVRQLLLGSEYGTDQVVTQGIDSQELIVLDGHLRLSGGAKVEIK